jgi:hypothetical protein
MKMNDQFDFMITDGNNKLIVIAKTETEALAFATEAFDFASGAGYYPRIAEIRCEGISIREPNSNFYRTLDLRSSLGGLAFALAPLFKN